MFLEKLGADALAIGNNEHAKSHNYQGTHLLKLPFKTYDLFSFDTSKQAVTVQTFDQFSINGVYNIDETRLGIFRINTSGEKAKQKFLNDMYIYPQLGESFVVYFVFGSISGTEFFGRTLTSDNSYRF